MFPVIFDKGVLRPNSEVKDGLVCVDRGPTLYQATRGELEHRFGPELVHELDEIAGQICERLQPCRAPA